MQRIPTPKSTIVGGFTNLHNTSPIDSELIPNVAVNRMLSYYRPSAALGPLQLWALDSCGPFTVSCISTLTAALGVSMARVLSDTQGSATPTPTLTPTPNIHPTPPTWGQAHSLVLGPAASVAPHYLPALVQSNICPPIEIIGVDRQSFPIRQFGFLAGGLSPLPHNSTFW